MINLMYLVLTALLALNVSNEILNAFKTLSLSIDKSNTAIDQKNDEVYQNILANEKAPGQEYKVKPYRIKADEVKKRSDDLVQFLNDWKKRIIIQSGGFNKEGEPEELKLPGRPDNIDATTLLLVEKNGGDTIKQKILEMRKFLLGMLESTDTASISPLMPIRITPARKNDHNPKADWSIENFEHMPSIAAIALFSKFQNDIRSSEALVLNKLFEEAHGKDIKFDTIGAVAVPKQSYVLEGDKVEASIMLAAFNREQKPTITGMSGGGSVKPAVSGIIPWETIAKGTGLQTIRGKIELNTEGGLKVRDWKFEYMVGTTGASLQLDKMNVFYIGVANPVTVAAAGYSVEDVSLQIPGAEVKPDSFNRKGHFNIWADKPNNNLEVAIMAKPKDGTGLKKVGAFPVRVKRIPDPVAKLGGKLGGGMSSGLFKVQVAPAATLEGFDFDARFTIVSFDFSMLPKGKDFQGPYPVTDRAGCYLQNKPGRSNPSIEKLIQTARPGDRIFIENIKAVGPDKTTRMLNPITLTLTN